MVTIHKYLILSLLLLGGGLFTTIGAQENLKKWIAKCENNSSVDITVIEKRDPKTGKKSSETTILLFPYPMDAGLFKDLLEAFDKDKEKAYRVSQKRVAGENRPDYCRFADLKNKIDTRFLFEFPKKERLSDKSARIVVTMQVYYDHVEPPA